MPVATAATGTAALEDRALLSGTPYDDTWAPEIDTASIVWPSGDEGAGQWDPVTFEYTAPTLEFTVTDKSPWGGGNLQVYVDWGDSTGTTSSPVLEATLSETSSSTDTDGNIVSSYQGAITHEWGDQGPWSINFTVRDDWSNEDSASGTATLNNVAPDVGTGTSSATGSTSSTWPTPSTPPLITSSKVARCHLIP